MKRHKLPKITQLIVIQSVRKQLPPAVRVFKDKRNKRNKRVDLYFGPYMEDGRLRNPEGFI